ncbi:PAS domain S-box protein [Pontiellaceae bacterium B1224]|nr:PAS domain S-box protein [Pontiellaceae bacterium B1224]
MSSKKPESSSELNQARDEPEDSTLEEVSALNLELERRLKIQTIALRESEERFRMLFEETSDACFLLDTDSRFIDGNMAVEKLTGYRCEELKGQSVFECGIFPPAAREIAVKRMDKLRKGETLTPIEYNLLHSDGTALIVEVTAVPLVVNGKPVYMCSARDRTQHKIVEKTQRESEERFRRIFDEVPDGILLADPETRKFRMASKAICTLLGYSEKEVIEIGSEGIHPAEDLPYVIESFEKQARGEVDEVYDIPFLRSNGEVFYADMKAFRIVLDGKQYLIGHVRDITERQRLRKALEKRVLALTQPLDGIGSVSFEDLFNFEDIQRIQDEFARATGVASLITHPDGSPITKPSNFTDFCSKIIRGTEKGCANCMKSDAQIGVQHEPEGPNIQVCLSAGLWDAGATIEVGGRHIANWLVGQVRDENQTDEQVCAYAREIGADEQAILEAFHRVPTMSRKHFEEIAQALFTLAKQLSTSAYQNMQQARFIAAQKKAEQAQKESEEKYRLVFESESDAIIIFDAKSRRFIDVNNAAVELYGHSREEFLDLTHREISVEPDVADRAIPEVLAGKSIGMLKSRHRKKDGSVFPVEITPCSFSWKGRPVVCGVVRDISQRVAREEEINLNREELRHLASELSLAGQHERQQITAQLHDGVSQFLSSSYIQLGALKETALPEETIKSLDKISNILHESLQQIRALTFDLSCPMLTELGLASALEELCSSMTGKHTTRFEFSGETKLLPLPFDRKVVLFRSVRELLTNVMRHSDAKSAQVALKRVNGNVRISVKDDGQGFDASLAGKGFSPSGGFGLFSIRENIQHNGGSLEIESTPGEGTEVVVSAPLEA